MNNRNLDTACIYYVTYVYTSSSSSSMMGHLLTDTFVAIIAMFCYNKNLSLFFISSVFSLGIVHIGIYDRCYIFLLLDKILFKFMMIMPLWHVSCWTLFLIYASIVQLYFILNYYLPSIDNISTNMYSHYYSF